MQFDDVKKLIKNECRTYGVRFYQGRGKTVIFDGVKSNGYYNPGTQDTEPTLAVIQGDIGVLVHEYCHMLQDMERAPVWKAIENKSHIWSWIAGNEGFTEKQLDASLLAYYNVEIDCERRTVAQFKKWNVDINLTEYIQKANAYTMFYFFMRECRVWYRPGFEPYNLEKVWKSMPKSFTFDRAHCYNKVRDLYNYCI